MPSETTPSEQGDKPPQVSGVMPEGLPETFHARVRPMSGPLMMSCTIEQNRQILVATAQEQLPVPELPASCETGPWIVHPYFRDHPGAAFPGAEDAVEYTIPRPYGSYRTYLDSTAARLLDLSLFRHAPHGVKADVYRDGAWLLQQRAASLWGPISGAPRALGDTAFLMDFASGIEAGGESPVYSFLHVITPHPPIATDADCGYAGGGGWV